MTDWPARIDALPPEPRHPALGANTGALFEFWALVASNRQARLALAAERLREPHSYNCRVGYDVNLNRMIPCECGKDADLLRILEGK